MMDYIPPSYELSQNSIGNYQVNVKFDETTEAYATRETTLNEEAKKSSLFAVAFIQKLAQDGDLQAIDLRTLYQAYRLFLENGNKEPFISKCDQIIQNDQADPLAKNCAKYIRSLLKNQPIDPSLENAAILTGYLIPMIEKTVTMNRLEMDYLPQEVTITEIKARHLAFPDLIKHQGQYYACFREADSHVAFEDFGKIRILKGNFNEEKKLGILKMMG